MRKIRGIVYALDALVAVETSAILVSGLFGGMAVWKKWFIMIVASVAIWRMIISIERMVLRKGKNEKKGQRNGGTGSVQGKPWYEERLQHTGKAHRHSSRYASKV